MNPPQVYPRSPTWTLLPPPSPTLPLGRPSAPAPSIQYRASNLDWRLVSYMIFYMFHCHSPTCEKQHIHLGKSLIITKILLSLVTHAAAVTAKSFQPCLTLCNPIDGSPPGSSICPWDSLGKNSGMGCHFLLQITHEGWNNGCLLQFFFFLMLLGF